MTKGIKLGKGGASRDFSNGDGFYLTASFDYAKGLPKGSVLVFGLTRLPQFTEMDLSTDKKNWEMIVKYNCCGRKQQTIKLPKDIDKRDTTGVPLILQTIFLPTIWNKILFL